MVIVGDNTNTVGSVTVTNRTDLPLNYRDLMISGDWMMLNRPYNSPIAYPTTDGESPVSNAVVESYMNALFPYRIDRVIFHDPASVVYWKDGTKTVVKCHDEQFDREKGLAMCIAKKVLGSGFHKTFREWCE